MSSASPRNGWRDLRELAAQGAFMAHQLHEMPGFVDEEQVAGVVKILTLELICSELQLDFVVAHPAGVHHAFTDVQRDLLRWSKRHHYGLGRLGHRTWLNHRSSTSELPRILGKRGDARETDDQRHEYDCSEH